MSAALIKPSGLTILFDEYIAKPMLMVIIARALDVGLCI